jgi:anthranilate phosphoribosyltransferase
VSDDALASAIRKLAQGGSLESMEATEAFDVVMSGSASAARMAALLVALRVKGETPAEVAGAARALRRAMVQLNAAEPSELVDTCGTGGGVVGTFNISTAAALVAAGAGVRVAKHGNRSFTSKCGSADVLEALGVRIEVTVPEMERALREAGVVFMFAPLMHPAMRHVGAVRRDLGIPSVMNMVGPLANPANAVRQVVGVAEEGRMRLIAGALLELDTIHALVVHGAPGLDEISPLGPTKVIEIREGKLSEWVIEPARFGIGGVTAQELNGGDPAENARVIEDVLAGGGTRGARAAVLLNAAGAIFVSGSVATLDEAFAAATASLDSGGAGRSLEALRDALASDRPGS